ncbi:MAG TPA: LacI family DNA-binding transcriptional regulator [Opitutaceae bacterium]|nr:LacI family DNA-binding transcriptional regulator [Opitutaceae bacterium]
MPRPRKISQTQLAKELGVSQAMVSLVLNGRREGISPETYERIWALAARRGYHPKGMRLAASPAAQARQVGFILRARLHLHTQSNYFSHVQDGLHTALAARGLATVFLGTETSLDEAKIRRIFQPGHLFQGIAVLGEVARPFLDELRGVERRIVAVSARYAGLCHSVVGNEPQALDLLVRHLQGLGHRRIGWLGGNAALGRHSARFGAFQSALQAAGLACDQRYCLALEQADRAEGGEAAHAMLVHARRKDFPTAFICYNTLMAVGATREWQRAGWEVPADVSLASADLSPEAAQAEPSVTAAGSSPEKLGEAAARLVLGSTGEEDEVFTDLMLPAQLLLGDTTGPVAGK